MPTEREREREMEENWSERVEDFVEEGNIDAAISFLESVVSKLETLNSSPQLSSALFDLSKLYYSVGLSDKADSTQSRALLLKHRNVELSQQQRQDSTSSSTKLGFQEKERVPLEVCSPSNDSSAGRASDDDWEAIADLEPDKLLSPQGLPELSKLSVDDDEVQSLNMKRRGRGTFSYRSPLMYSDWRPNESSDLNSEDPAAGQDSERNQDTRNSIYGTDHVLVLADFPPTTTTMDLEKLLENCKDKGFVIRWVNDTVALVVFPTRASALDACKSINVPFKVRLLEENDVLMSSIKTRDLEPPRRRPKTSAQAAKRLIAHGMGLKLSSTNFGSMELREQEEARKNRIQMRQNLRDEAWGPDDEN